MTILDWLIVALFLGTLMAIGYAFSRRNKDVEDYFVAGRSMPGWIVAIAATGTTISAGTFVGSPELGFNTDLTYVLNLLGSIVGGMVVAALIMPKLYKANTITIYGFIGDRFGESVPAIFTDEPNANHENYMFAPTPEYKGRMVFTWTRFFEETFQKTYGADILDTLPELAWRKKDGSDSLTKYRFFDFVHERI